MKKQAALLLAYDAIILGYALHNLYCSLEDLFEQVAYTFENTIEDPARFHAELLKRMKLDVPNIRPAFLSDESYRVLSDLRAFRHVFRHGYDYTLDGPRVKASSVAALDIWDMLERDKDQFRAFLLELMEVEE